MAEDQGISRLNAGKQFLASGDLNSAWVEFQQAVQYDGSGEAYLELAKLELGFGQHEFAGKLARFGLSLARKNGPDSTIGNDLAELRARITEQMLPRRKARNKARMSGDLKEFIGTYDMTPALAARLEKTIIPTFKLRSRPDPSDKAMTKLGGVPNIPGGFKWPRNNSDIPLGFICQINLADLPRPLPHKLPDSGLLSFFYDAEDQPWGDPWGNDDGDDCWRVIYFPDPTKTKQIRVPKTLPEASQFKPCALAISQQLTIPSELAVELEDIPADAKRVLWNVVKEWYHYPDYAAPVHHFLGHAEFEQHDPRSHWPDGNKWILLLQIDSDQQAGMTWGDMGMIYFFIREDALRNMDFSKIRLALKCT